MWWCVVYSFCDSCGHGQREEYVKARNRQETEGIVRIKAGMCFERIVRTIKY